jgi:hypothetical protein
MQQGAAAGRDSGFVIRYALYVIHTRVTHTLLYKLYIYIYMKHEMINAGCCMLPTTAPAPSCQRQQRTSAIAGRPWCCGLGLKNHSNNSADSPPLAIAVAVAVTKNPKSPKACHS